MTQQEAFEILKLGHNTFLTGSAGTGKSYLLNQYITYLRSREVPLAITASTGIAATHIGGQTIHSWSGIGIKDTVSKGNLVLLEKNDKLAKRLRSVRVLIIDEISMLSGKILTGVSEILKHIRKSPEPFGGLQVILSGDFFQLPPVFKIPVPSKDKFAFMAPVWVEAGFKICYLTQQYRQEQSPLDNILACIRSRSQMDQCRRHLQVREVDDSSVDAIRLFTHNVDVDALNEKELQVLLGEETTFQAKTKGSKPLVETLKSSVLAQPTLKLKEKAKVMFVRNNPERGYHNGTLGTVMDFDEEGYPLIKTTQDRWIVAKPEEWTISDDNDKILASYKQLPLRLAWAITIHKSQGMTLDRAEIDLSRTFEPGQGYVALSRLRSLEGLYLRGWNDMALQIDNLAFKADQRFQELSEDHRRELTQLEKEAIATSQLDFVERCGGTNDPETIKKNEHKVREVVSAKKENTYDRTKKLVEQGQTLEEIAFERDLTQGTIISHLQHIMKDHPNLDLSKFKPDDKHIERVSKVISKLESQGDEAFYDIHGKIKLGYIFKALNGSMDYEDIRLARLFL